MEKEIVFGLCVTESKMGKLRWGNPSELGPKCTHNLKVIPVPPKQLANSFPNSFDVLVTKITDQLSAGDPDSLHELELVKDFIAKNPHIKVCDLPDTQAIFSRRDLLAAKMPDLANFPRQLTVLAKDILEGKCCPDLEYPLICKSVTACGIASAHIMRVCFGPKGVREFAESVGADASFVIQKYVNHNAELLKVYLLGKKTFFERRISVPNLVWDGKGEEPAPLVIDNNINTYEQILVWKDHPCVVVPENLTPNPPQENMPVDEMRDLALAVAEHFEATFMGIDLVRVNDTGKLVVIDVNYFPSYRGCLTGPQFFDALYEHLTE